jgi:hypothetical protein
LLGAMEAAELHDRLANLDWTETSVWREADDPLVTWQTEVLLALSGVFLAAASEPGAREDITERALLRVMACLDYADWSGASWPPSTT